MQEGGSMVGGLGDFLLKQEEVGEQEREDLVMWLHQVRTKYASAKSLSHIFICIDW